MIYGRPPIYPLLFARAREMRKNMTPEERHLWYDFLKTCRDHVKRQYVLGPYILDFYCVESGLVIEVDGRQHYDEKSRDYDARRTAYIEQFGLQVVRVLNRDIHKNFPAVCQMLDKMMEEREREQD